MTLQHFIRYLYSIAQSDIMFDSSKCVNCTKSAMTKISINYDESVLYFGNVQKWVGIIGSFRIDEQENITLHQQNTNFSGSWLWYHCSLSWLRTLSILHETLGVSPNATCSTISLSVRCTPLYNFSVSSGALKVTLYPPGHTGGFL